MRIIQLAVLAAFFAGPLQAATYYYSYTLGVSNGGYYLDHQTVEILDEDITVTGFIETDGTLGRIDESNIIDWNFTITGSFGTGTVREGRAGFAERVYADFEATSDSLVAIGVYRFSEFRHNGNFDHGSFGVAGNTDQAEYAYDDARMTQTFPDGTRYGAVGHVRTGGDSSFVGYSGQPQDSTTQPNPSPVPLPASVAFLALGLGGLGVLRRKRR